MKKIIFKISVFVLLMLVIAGCNNKQDVFCLCEYSMDQG